MCSRKQKIEIEFQAAQKLVAILSLYFDKIIRPNKSKIKEIIKVIKEEILYIGLALFLKKNVASLLCLIKTNYLRYSWYQVPIPDAERNFFEGLYKTEIKKFQQVYNKSKGRTRDGKMLKDIVKSYYKFIPLITFAFLILEYTLYNQHNTLPPSIVILTKNEEEFWVKSILKHQKQLQNLKEELSKK